MRSLDRGCQVRLWGATRPVPAVDQWSCTSGVDPFGAHAAYLQNMDMSGDHAIALMGVLFLPVAVIPVLLALQLLAGRSPRAAGLWSRIETASPMTRLGSLLLLATADIHLTLVPVHLVEEPITGVLFLLDGIALTAVALAAFATPRWRAPAIALLVANILAYALYLVAGWEGADIVGVGTKLVELAGIIVVMRSYGEGSAHRQTATVTVPAA
jgi:hypothetical protein